MKDRHVIDGKLRVEAPIDQVAALDAEQLGRGKVRSEDLTAAIEGEVGDRGEVVEVAVFFCQCLHLGTGALKFLILHLQFDLVDL